MAPPLEKQFLALVQQDLRQLRNAWHIKTQETARRGIPDILMCLAGHFVAIELKRDSRSKATPLQKHVLERIATRGMGLAYCACPENWAQIISDLRQLDQHGKLVYTG